MTEVEAGVVSSESATHFLVVMIRTNGVEPLLALASTVAHSAQEAGSNKQKGE